MDFSVCCEGERVLGLADNLLDGNHFDQSLPDPKLDSDHMTIDEMPISSGKGRSGYMNFTTTDEFEKVSAKNREGDFEADREDVRVSLSDCINPVNGGAYDSRDKVAVLSLKTAVEAKIQVPAAMQRAYVLSILVKINVN